MEEIIIKKVDEKSIDTQVTVYIKSFENENEFESIKEHWINKHYKNPIRNSIIFAAFVDEVMVGVNAFMPMRYSYNGQLINVVQSCESGVLPQYRRRGIFLKIIKFAMDYFTGEKFYDLMIGFPNHVNSYQGFLKLGWSTICNVNNLLLINKGANSVHALLGKSNYQLIGKFIEIQKIIIRMKALFLKTYKLEAVKDVPEELNNYERNSNKITLQVDKDWLDWKNLYNAQKQYVIKKEGQSIAYCLSKLRELKGISYCEVIYVFGLCENKKDYQNSFVVFVNELLKQEETNFIRLWGNKTGINNSLYNKMGFLCTVKHQNPFIGFILNNEKFKKEELFNSCSWDLSFLDLD